MGDAILAGRRFRVDPSSIAWSFEAKTQKIETVGGRVIQVFGTRISDMTLSGSFGVGGWRQQRDFLDEMLALAHEQAEHGMKERAPRHQHRFIYPPRGWDFLVYLKQYSTPDGQESVVHSPEIFNPRWNLTLFIVEDNAGLRNVAENAYISRLAKGLGWTQTEYNGGILAPGSAIAQSGAANTSSAASGMSGRKFPPNVERWRGLVARHFPANVVDEALRIIQCESEGNPNARNPQVTVYGNAHGLFQHMDKLWPERSAKAGVGGRSFYDPEANIIVAAMLYRERNNWSHWECGKILGFV